MIQYSLEMRKFLKELMYILNNIRLRNLPISLAPHAEDSMTRDRQLSLKVSKHNLNIQHEHGQV